MQEKKHFLLKRDINNWQNVSLIDFDIMEVWFTWTLWSYGMISFTCAFCPGLRGFHSIFLQPGPSRYTHRICNSRWVMPRKGNFNPWKEARVKRCQCQVTFAVLTSQGGKREGYECQKSKFAQFKQKSEVWVRGTRAVVRTLTSVMTVSPPEPPEPPAQCYSTSWLNLWKPRWDRHDELRQPRVEHGEENEQEHKSKRACEREKRKGGEGLRGGGKTEKNR